MSVRTSAMLAAAALVTLSGAVRTQAATTLLNDTFNTSVQSIDLNFELSSRQTGTRALAPYVDNGGADNYRTQVNEGSYPGAGFLLPAAGFSSPFNPLVASPNFNFNQDGANLAVSIDLLTGNTNNPLVTGDLIGFDIGANNVGDLAYDGSGFGIILRPHLTGVAGQDNYQIFYGNSFVAGGNNSAIVNSSNTVKLTIDAAAFDGSAAAVTASVNGTLLFSGTKGDGFVNNFVTVSAADFGGSPDNFFGFDNLNIAAVPEPASLGLLGVVGAGMLARRRRAR